MDASLSLHISFQNEGGIRKKLLGTLYFRKTDVNFFFHIPFYDQVHV